MASRGNPNTPSKSRRIANRAKVQKRNAKNGVFKAPRGTRISSVLTPTSGPLAPLSGKKARKVEKAKNHARRRAIEKAMEQEGEVEMTDAPKTTKSKAEKSDGGDVDMETIS
ncbi:uncharacterized protein PAC_19501 [Phialocephala subalpina]|uniref:Uncharacterized protein n=1 Tax=Phialocephala subalpina TaxID=576137 RepID=A0A1L7XX19_9HELO|nr:uncharacterized protein PAC_19501 [Phialocephala subalpina]